MLVFIYQITWRHKKTIIFKVPTNRTWNMMETVTLRDLDVEGMRAAMSWGHGDGTSVDKREGIELTAHQLVKKDIWLNSVRTGIKMSNAIGTSHRLFQRSNKPNSSLNIIHLRWVYGTMKRSKYSV